MTESVKKVFEAKKGDIVDIHCFFSKEKKVARNGNSFLNITLHETTGDVYARIWPESKLFNFFDDDSNEKGVLVRGKIERDTPYKSIEIYTATKKELPISSFADVGNIKKEIGAVMRGIQDPGLKELLIRIFRDVSFSEAYFKAPMTLVPSSGGSWSGGVAAFVSKLCRLIDQTTNVFNEWPYSLDEFSTKLNVDFLKTLAILEPIGKVRAFAINKNKTSLTVEGEYMGDHFLTMEIVLEHLIHVDMPEEKKILLKHAIASIPGKKEWGALIYDRTREAIFFNYLWQLNMQMMHFEQMDRMSADDDFVSLFKKRVSLSTFSPYPAEIGDSEHQETNEEKSSEKQSETKKDKLKEEGSEEVSEEMVEEVAEEIIVDEVEDILKEASQSVDWVNAFG